MNISLENKLVGVELYLHKAQLLEKENIIQDAIAVYREAIEVYPRHFRLHYELGQLLTKSQSCTEAIKYYQQAISLNPQWFKPYYDIGQIAQQQNDFELAIEHYQQAIKLKPEYPWSYSSQTPLLCLTKTVLLNPIF